MMIVDRFTNFDQLDSIQKRWGELYQLDPNANFFLSWDWLRASYATEGKPWTVLAVREGDGPYLAFLPLTCSRFPRFGPPLNRELCLAGSPRADYTGMLAVPDAPWDVIKTLAHAVEGLAWDNFTLNDYADPRIRAMISEFACDRYRVVPGETTTCPFVQLPATWEEYIGSRSYATRRTLRAKMRKIEGLPGFRLHVAQGRDADAEIETLLRVNSVRWNKNLRKRRRVFGELFARCYAAGCFNITVLYDGETVLAAQGSFVDPRNRRIFGYMMGYNAQYSRLSPGSVLVGLCIRRAIEQGYSRYDLARGDEGYKASLATDIDYTTHTTLTRKSIRVAAVNASRRGFFAAKGLARDLLVRPA
jgi:CelD/BcsL family acetyltransferase involved in cellulose biosynthesis